jgi:uncharacterized protein (DUF4213/DUF364 family)
MPVPCVARVFVPPYAENPDKSAEFVALGLTDGSIGLAFALLDGALADLQQGAAESLIGEHPLMLMQQLDWRKASDRVLGLACINAISQYLFRASGYRFDRSDSVAGLAIDAGDHVGMVGYFPPLVARLRAQAISLTVLELNAELVQREDSFRVTLDPLQLRQCNKILCTSSVLLNDTLRELLGHCRQAKLAIIGPSAGLLPDLLFRDGVDILGGLVIDDQEAFWRCCEAGQAWGQTGRKYCIQRSDYPGQADLLAAALSRSLA